MGIHHFWREHPLLVGRDNYSSWVNITHPSGFADSKPNKTKTRKPRKVPVAWASCSALMLQDMPCHPASHSHMPTSDLLAARCSAKICPLVGSVPGKGVRSRENMLGMFVARHLAFCSILLQMIRPTKLKTNAKNGERNPTETVCLGVFQDKLEFGPSHDKSAPAWDWPEKEDEHDKSLFP